MSSRTRRSYDEFLDGIQKIAHNLHGPHTYDMYKAWRQGVTDAWKRMASAAVTVSEWNNDLLDAETETAVKKLNEWAARGHRKSADDKSIRCKELDGMSPEEFRTRLGLSPTPVHHREDIGEASEAILHNSPPTNHPEHGGSAARPITIASSPQRRSSSVEFLHEQPIYSHHHNNEQASYDPSSPASPRRSSSNTTHQDHESILARIAPHDILHGYEETHPASSRMHKPISNTEIYKQLDEFRESPNYPPELKRQWHNQGHDQQDVPIHSHFEEHFDPAHYDNTQHALGKGRERRGRCEPMARGRRERAQVFAV